jgi:hypothetical protein
MEVQMHLMFDKRPSNCAYSQVKVIKSSSCGATTLNPTTFSIMTLVIMTIRRTILSVMMHLNGI